jgi:hypothetical protein
VLVHGYHRIDSALVLPQVRAAIEESCNLIAKGQASKDEVYIVPMMCGVRPSVERPPAFSFSFILILHDPGAGGGSSAE